MTYKIVLNNQCIPNVQCILLGIQVLQNIHLFFFTGDNYCTCHAKSLSQLEEIHFSLLRPMVVVMKILVRLHVLIFLLFLIHYTTPQEIIGGWEAMTSKIIET